MSNTIIKEMTLIIFAILGLVGVLFNDMGQEAVIFYLSILFVVYLVWFVDRN